MTLKDLTTEYKLSLVDTITNGNDAAEARAIRKMQRLKITEAAHKYDIWQQPDGRWATYVPDAVKGGRRKVVKKDQEKLLDYLEDFYDGKGNPEDFPTLDEVYPRWQRYKALECETASVKRWDCDWKKFYKNETLSSTLIHTPMDKITRRQIKEWAMKVKKKYNLTDKAFKGMMTILIGCFDMLMDDDRLQFNPAKDIKLTKFKRVPEKEIYTKEQAHKIIAKCVELARQNKDEMWLAIPMMYYTGERIGEVEGLHFDDFKDGSNVIVIRHSLKANDRLKEDGTFETRTFKLTDSLKQNADPRDVLVSDEAFMLRDEVKRILEEKGKTRQKVLFKVQTHGNIGSKFRRVCRWCDVPVLGTHSLRRTYSSHVAAQTGDAKFLMNQLGHKKFTTTMNHYIKSTSSDEAKILVLKNAL